MTQGNDHHVNRRILLLGGTAEARQLASRLVAQGHRVTSSLAGRTATPLLPEGEVRIGGFGGPDGLARWIVAHRIDLVIDATHPYAAKISANAVAACAATRARLIRIERPVWEPPEGAGWTEVADMGAAARAFPGGARVLLTIGRQELEAFHHRTDCSFLARVIDPPSDAPQGWLILAARGPFALEDEMALMRAHPITHLVSKNSGGEQTHAKIEAAAQLGIDVVMVTRPRLPPAETVRSADEVLGRLAEA